MADHPIFGSIEYDGFFWSGTVTLTLQGRKTAVPLTIYTDEGEDFSQGQYDAFTALVECWDQLWPTIPEQILEYYTERRRQLGYDAEVDDIYPPINTPEELLAHIQLTGISIPYEDIYGGRSAGITFDCTWDPEHGVGLCLCNEQVTEIGAQDITM